MFGDDPAAVDDIVSQFVVIEKKTRNPETGLLYHAWDESALQPWSDDAHGIGAFLLAASEMALLD